MSLFKMSVKSILTFSILIFSLFLFTQNSIAVTFTVTNLNDSGDGSLRAAIIASNTSAGVDDEIVFMVGLTGAIPTDAGADNVFSEEMAITEDVTITGPGANAITIDAQMVDRIFNIDDGSDPDIVVSISGLRLINGLADSGGIGNLGGAIYNAEELSIDSCVFEKNSANSFGGAIFNDGTITEITNCTFTENSADDRDGGAIFNNNVGLITKIADSNFTGNSAKEWGGAISNFKTITEITDSNFTENSAGVDGGAIDNRGTITKITNSTFTGNSAERDGGAIFGGADFRGSPTIIEITNCTFSGNSAHDDGGAIYNQTGTITITNCTFTGNSAGDDGGAIYNQTGNTNISFTTIANNEADEGGGIFSTEATTNIRNSIVAFNTAATPGENCNVDIADENSNETNNYSNDDSCGFGLGGDDTEIKQDPLADNGGFTETHALLEGDPVDGASPDCRRIGSDGTPTETALANDQRDFPRPSGPACDSGAYEAQLSALVEAPGAYEAQLSALFSFFDLRNRESFVQLTSIDTIDGTVHVQIFNVSNNCSENNFFDTYTPNDTHVYNMRDIQTNNGNPSGVILPDGAYGFVSIVPVNPLSIIGNFRVIDNNGYEYRTNSVNLQNVGLGFFTESATFNFNTKGNITLSDVVGLTFDFDFEEGEVSATDILDNFVPVDINIVNENEVIFSCRNVVFACTDQDNPLLEALLEEAGVASVASFEYGINNAIPHSKGSELLCPGNTISDGVVTIDRIQAGDSQDIGFIGLNNGNGRGSMDSWWYPNMELLQPPPPG